MRSAMAFIKAQKVIRDENGTITSGSAAIVDTVYVIVIRNNDLSILYRYIVRNTII